MSITLYPILNYMRQTLLNFLLTSLCFCLPSYAWGYIVKDFGQLRTLFTQVETDVKKGKLSSYRQHQQALKEYPLYPYLQYELINQRLTQVTPTELSKFITTYPDFPLNDKLKQSWLLSKAQHKDWGNFLKIYQTQSNTELKCHYLQANLDMRKQQPSDQANHIRALWLSGSSQPKSCDKIFHAWNKSGHLTKSLVWQRIKLAMESNNIQLAGYLSKFLPEKDRHFVDLWIRVSKNPDLIKTSHNLSYKHQIVSEILVYGINKIARQDPNAAITHWKNLSKKHKFTETHWGEMVRSIGLALANNNHPEAAKWLEKVPPQQLSPAVFDARLKLAVSKNGWNTIKQLSTLVPHDLAKQEKWQYWHARALEMTGAKMDSQEKLKTLADNRSYYGFLSSLRMVKPYTLRHKPLNIKEQDINQFLKIPAIQRAYELYRIGRLHQGTVEWNQTLPKVPEQQRQAAAKLANDWQVPNWSIIALANASHKDDLSLRFPKTYSNFIFKEASHNRLDPALIFAITRQESAFVPTARSPAGALGLMQVMPNTAKDIAKHHRLLLKNNKELLKADKNINFGSKYLRMMLAQYQSNSVLATAAYNAGPSRVQQWLPEYDMPADHWIETIPFKETRNYVQNVLTYTVIYQELLGKKPKLNYHMPMIIGKKNLLETQKKLK